MSEPDPGRSNPDDSLPPQGLGERLRRSAAETGTDDGATPGSGDLAGDADLAPESDDDRPIAGG